MDLHENKYKDALDLARTFYEGYIIQGHNGEAGILAEIFPELAESEDERIRKGIIRNLEYLADRAEGSVKDELKERIAWLEKQGEQKTDPCIGCTNDKGCVTCEHGELRETPTRTLNADKVIEWIRENIPIYGNYVMIDRFKKDFDL